MAGRSGCGKTTITRLLNGLIPNFYEGSLTGGIAVGGKHPNECQPHELSGLVGSVFQNPRTQFFNTDSTSEIVFGMENAGMPRDEMRKRFERTVKDLQLNALVNRSIFALSGGEKQRVAFGGVYALLPQVYVLDEPTANLDANAIRALRGALMQVKKQGGTIVVAEHCLHYLNGVADRIVLIKEGRIHKEWTAKSFAQLADDTLAEDGLRPFHKTLISAAQNDCKAASGSAIELKSLTVGYGKTKVLETFDFAADKAEIVGIAGANGNGKTTLARTICGLHREFGGTVLFDGKAVRQNKRSKYAYLVMQDPNYQLFTDSVENELRLCTEGKPPSDAQIKEILKSLELSEFKRRHPLSLSGGQKQRLAIALAALSPAQVLIFDEPTSGLDRSNMRRVTDMLGLLAGRGKTILVITHDSELLVARCHRIVNLPKKVATL